METALYLLSTVLRDLAALCLGQDISQPVGFAAEHPEKCRPALKNMFKGKIQLLNALAVYLSAEKDANFWVRAL